MGNNLSSKKSKKEITCFICSKKILEKDYALCIRCEVVFHSECELYYRNNKSYTECPNCNRYGSIGVSRDDDDE